MWQLPFCSDELAKIGNFGECNRRRESFDTVRCGCRVLEDPGKRGSQLARDPASCPRSALIGLWRRGTRPDRGGAALKPLMFPVFANGRWLQAATVRQGRCPLAGSRIVAEHHVLPDRADRAGGFLRPGPQAKDSAIEAASSAPGLPRRGGEAGSARRRRAASSGSWAQSLAKDGIRVPPRTRGAVVGGWSRGRAHFRRFEGHSHHKSFVGEYLDSPTC